MADTKSVAIGIDLGTTFSCVAVMKGGSYFSETLDQSQKSSDIQNLDSLSPSERKILKHVADKMSSEEIAQRLFISTRTVEKHPNLGCPVVGKRNSSGDKSGGLSISSAGYIILWHPF